jgi:hypothetical protein
VRESREAHRPSASHCLERRWERVHEYGKAQGRKGLMAMVLKSRCSSVKSGLGPCFLNKPMFHRAWNEGGAACVSRIANIGDVLRAISHGGVGVRVRHSQSACGHGKVPKQSLARRPSLWTLENVSATAETGRIGRRSWLPSIGGHRSCRLSRTHQGVPHFLMMAIMLFRHLIFRVTVVFPDRCR